MWRGEVRVVSVAASIGLLWVGPERVLVLRSDGVGHARWVQELFVVTEDEEEEESGETEFDEEGENIRPGGPVPCSITPCAQRGVSMGPLSFFFFFFFFEDSHLKASALSSVVLLTGPQNPQLCQSRMYQFIFSSAAGTRGLT